MSKNHTIQQGDCITSLAEKEGFSEASIWDNLGNSKLKNARANGHILLPGDTVAIPKKVEGSETIATEQKHKFVRRNQVTKLMLQVDLDREPRANEEYALRFNGGYVYGVTDSNGYIEERIPSDIEEATLIFNMGDTEEQYEIKLGSLDPITEISGVQARLTNLGYDCGPIDNIYGKLTAAGLRVFQGEFELDISGEIDDLTTEQLKEEYGA